VFAREQSWESEKAQYEEKVEELYTEIGKLSTQLSWLKKKGLHVDP
jgi:transposase